MTKKAKIDLDSVHLGAAARKVRAQLSEDQIKQLLKIPSMDPIGAEEKLASLPRPVKDRDIVGLIMAMQRRKASEGDFARIFTVIQSYFAAYKNSWLSGARDLCTALIEAEEAAKRGVVGPVNVVNKTGFDELVAYTLDGLEQLNAANPRLFRYGSELSRIVAVKEEDTASIDVLTVDALSASIPLKFERQLSDKKRVSAAPPLDVVKRIYHTPKLPLPYLAGVARFPTFGEDGGLQLDEGYSAATQTFYAPPVGLEIPKVGGWADESARQRAVDEALRLLIDDALGDFPFDGWTRPQIIAALDETGADHLPASLVNALGLLIETAARPMINGPVPLTLIGKPVAGTGATALATAIQIIINGRTNVRAPLPASEEERRKTLFTAVRGGENVILYDNQSGQLDSPTVASILTSTTFTDRILGRSEERSLPLRSSFVITANNLTLSEEIQRRVSLIRLDAKMADPKARTGYKHPDLESWLEINRGQIVWAILTLISNWVALGCQGPKRAPAVASYPGWSFVVGGILEAAGLTSWQTNRSQIATYASAGEEDGFTALVEAWADMGGDRSAAELASLIEDLDIEIDGLKARRDGSISTRSLGQQLAKYNGRRFAVDGGELEIFKSGSVKNTTTWGLRRHDSSKVASVSVIGPKVPPKYRNYPLFAPRAQNGLANHRSIENGDNLVPIRGRKRAALASSRRQARKNGT